MNETLKEFTLMLSGFGSQKMEDIGIPAFIFLMAVSLLVSLFITLLYAYFYQRRATGSQIHRAFPLLGISITGIFICIQFSLPLSLGLLGALSIVRFRTPIKEPEEIGFLMLVIASSIACATFNLVFLAILLVIAVSALLILAFMSHVFGEAHSDGMIVITMPETAYLEKSSELFVFLKQRLSRGRVEHITSSDDHTVISYSFARPRHQTLGEFQTDLKAFSDILDINMFFNRTGVA